MLSLVEAAEEPGDAAVEQEAVQQIDVVAHEDAGLDAVQVLGALDADSHPEAAYERPAEPLGEAIPTPRRFEGAQYAKEAQHAREDGDAGCPGGPASSLVRERPEQADYRQ